MTSLFGYIFGTKSSDQPKTPIHNIGEDDQVRQKELADDWIVVNENKPSTPNEEEFERMEQSVASLVEFTPTLSSSDMDEQTKLRFRLFLQEQHQQHVLRGRPPQNRLTEMPTHTPTPVLSEPRAGVDDDFVTLNALREVIDGPMHVELRVDQFVEAPRNNSAVMSKKASRAIQFNQSQSKSRSNSPHSILFNKRDQGTFPRNCTREIKGLSHRTGSRKSGKGQHVSRK